MAAIHITKQDFISRIWDYETNRGEWAFKGDRPFFSVPLTDSLR